MLFAVSTLVRRIIADIGADTGRVRQLILMTHNAHFHKEVAYRTRKQPRVPRTFGPVRKRGRHPSVIEFSADNPIETASAALCVVRHVG
ncbi:hypothetical protein [Cryobacterium sp. SO1]|uniref:hypothetical protein n=1 Tax=Cryobacterium sp. SO1 TaxID=1897061 RepID=UPI00351EE507